MKLSPLSWASDIADKLGVKVWMVWAALIVVGFLVLNFLGGGQGGGYVGRWLL